MFIVHLVGQGCRALWFRLLLWSFCHCSCHTLALVAHPALDAWFLKCMFNVILLPVQSCSHFVAFVPLQCIDPLSCLVSFAPGC